LLRQCSTGEKTGEDHREEHVSHHLPPSSGLKAMTDLGSDAGWITKYYNQLTGPLMSSEISDDTTSAVR
jgi:hypothetical protein